MLRKVTGTLPPMWASQLIWLKANNVSSGSKARSNKKEARDLDVPESHTDSGSGTDSGDSSPHHDETSWQRGSCLDGPQPGSQTSSN